VHELNVPFPTGQSEITEKDMTDLYSRFDELYEKSYGKGSGYREAGKEVITFRMTARGQLRRPRVRSQPTEKGNQDQAVKEQRDVYFEEYRDFVKTRIFDFERLKPGIEISGPAVIETPVTTIVANPRDRAIVDEFHNVRLFVGV
jgi:N-methylhydantoinase A